MPQESEFPQFDKVKPENVVPAMKALLEALHKGIDELEQVQLRSMGGRGGVESGGRGGEGGECMRALPPK
jgi:hypothetical protein